VGGEGGSGGLDLGGPADDGVERHFGLFGFMFWVLFFERLKRGGGNGGKKVEGEMATNERKKRKPRFLKKRKPGVTNKFLTLLPPPTTPLRFPSPRSLAPPTFHK
jgi:hypothetical protein